LIEELLTAAKQHTKAGRYTVPITSGKAPTGKGWNGRRLKGEELPEAFNGAERIGLLTGVEGNPIVDVDLDCWEAREVAAYFLPDPNGKHGRASAPGSHRWYCGGEGFETRQFRDPIGSDKKMLVELRGRGMQTMIPPSIHPNGEVLTWEIELPDQPPANPVDMAGLERAVAKVAAASLLVRYWPEGSRHHAVLALAGWLYRSGWDPDDIEYFVEIVAACAGDEEIPDRLTAVRDTIRNFDQEKQTTGLPSFIECLGQVGEGVCNSVREWLGLKKDSAHFADGIWEPVTPFEDAKLPRFPTEVLPRWLREFVECESIATQTPRDLSAMLVLSSCATVSAKQFKVSVRNDWREPLNVWTLTALPPGCRKSAVFGDVTRPIREYEQQEGKRMAPEIAEAAERRQIAEEKLKKWRSEVTGDIPGKQKKSTIAEEDVLRLAREVDQMKVPAAPRLVVDDITMEKLATMLEWQGGRLALLTAEGGMFEIIAGLYSGGSANYDVFLKGHAGDDLMVDRQNRESVCIRNPALTLGLAVQPEVVRSLAGRSGFRGKGLLGRFWYCLPPNWMGCRQVAPPGVPDNVREEYRRRMLALLEMQIEETERILTFSAEALAAFEDFEQWLEPQLDPDGELGGMTDWAGKLAGAVVRIAGILHVAEHQPSDNFLISRDTLRAAIQIGEYLIPHARAAYAMLGADPAIEEAKSLFRWITRNGEEEFKKKECFDGVRGQAAFGAVKDIDRGLGLLVEHGYIRPKTQDRQGPGRRSEVYQVNPAVFGNSLPEKHTQNEQYSRGEHTALQLPPLGKHTRYEQNSEAEEVGSDTATMTVGDATDIFADE
jgi:replicative DNA helicase